MTPETTIHNGLAPSAAPSSTPHVPAQIPPNTLIHLSHGSVPAMTAGLSADKQIEPLIARMEADMEAARKQGMWGVMRLRYEAWLEERMRGPAIQKMQTRQAVLAEPPKTAEAEIRFRATVPTHSVSRYQ